MQLLGITFILYKCAIWYNKGTSKKVKTTSEKLQVKCTRKKVSLKISLKTASDDESLIWSGSLFQSLGAATAPYVLRFALGSSSNLLFEDLS